MKTDSTSVRIKGEAREVLDRIRGDTSRDKFVTSLILYAGDQGISLMMYEPKRINLSEGKVEDGKKTDF